MKTGNPNPKPGRGRKKGVPNRSTQEMRDRILAFLNSPIADFQKIAEGLTQKELAEFVAKLLTYVVARPDQAIDLKASGGMRLIVEKVESQ